MHKVTELLMAFWKTVFERARAFIFGAEEPAPPSHPAGPYRSEPEPKVEKPVETKPAEEKPVEKPAKPEEEKPKLLKDGSKLVCTVSNEGSRSKSQITEIKKKTRRRAIRHFEGKEVKHRVTEKKPDSIEFAFFRRSGNPVKVRWQKMGARTEQNPGA